MITLQAIELFVHVAEHSTFASAATRFGVTPSTVTRQIQQLETALGARLLQRSTRNVSLTEAGRHYLPHAQALLEAHDSGSAVLNQLTQRPSGTLRLTAPLVLTTLYLVPAIPSFLKKYPSVKIDLQLSDDYLNLIDIGFDLAIRQGNTHDSSVVARRLFSFDRSLCASPAYLAAHGIPTTPDDLKNHVCIPYNRTNKDMVWQFQKNGKREKVIPTGTLQSNCINSLKQLTLAGVGICRLPNKLIQNEVATGGLVKLLPDWQNIVDDQLDTFYAVYPQRKLLSPKVGAFLEHVQQYLRDQQL
ncbi:LysR family transcriptional regulator [Leeia sp. TBRC 13508]|uniref:LysR family transcriptional regulator n=1 Tax=Leeia speluncae TaxID=2884804 RepID=A0ABS8D4K4_9NEIS|nr:LysR family transcriptional regulator [Leeia speluncae]MCB6183125.1 LysR family transcriptional regulator [Leeia speluncae]